MIQRFQYKSILPVFLAVLILGVGAWGLYDFYSKPKFERIMFSYEKHPLIQKQVANLLNKEYDGLSVSPNDIAVALIDLNDDRVPEVITYSMAGGISGVGGGYTGFYCQSPSGLKLLSNSCLTAGTLYKSTNTTNGYHDVISYVVGVRLEPEKDRKLLLAWDKKRGYDYVWMTLITQKERERELNYEQNL